MWRQIIRCAQNRHVILIVPIWNNAKKKSCKIPIHAWKIVPQPQFLAHQSHDVRLKTDSNCVPFCYLHNFDFRHANTHTYSNSHRKWTYGENAFGLFLKQTQNASCITKQQPTTFNATIHTIMINVCNMSNNNKPLDWFVWFG